MKRTISIFAYPTLGLFFGLFLTATAATAQTFVGTFVMTKGDVKILRNAEAFPKGPFLVYEGKKFAYEPAKIGKKVSPNEIVQSGTNGRAKLVFPSGDHFNIGPGTSMSIPTPTKTKDGKPSPLNLFYGRVRSLISKKGPLKGMKVRTPSAVAGVRGTDFFTRYNPTEGSQLAVLRGEVLVKAKADKKPVAVKKGYRVEVAKGTQTAQVAMATKEELMDIQRETALRLDQKAIEKAAPEVREEVLQLTQKSKQAVMADIQKDDPKLYEQLQAKMKTDDLSSEEINTTVVSRLFEQAPGDVKKKPTAEEMRAMGKDVYDKYFKPAK